MNTRVAIQTGTVIDHRYRVVKKIGEGGFADVYHAEHITLGRPAALKVLDVSRGDSDGNYIRRFQQEAKIAANFEHANVVRIFDFGVVQETQSPYIAMELLRGLDLDVQIRQHGAMHPFRAQKLFIGCLDALAQAHRRGIIHKDLKPANLFLQNPNTSDEKLVIMDFGIARLDGDSRLTQTGAFAGTPAYLAPEYIQEQIVTPAFDVYQMGLILIEALAGQAAIRADSFLAYLVKHVQGQHEIPEGITTSTLGPILLKAIAIDPAERYPTAQEFLEAVEAVAIPRVPTSDFAAAPGFSTSGTDRMPSVDNQSREILPTAHTEDSMVTPAAMGPSTGPVPTQMTPPEAQRVPGSPEPSVAGSSNPVPSLQSAVNPGFQSDSGPPGRTEMQSRVRPASDLVPKRQRSRKRSSALPVFLYLMAILIFAMFTLFMLGLFIAVMEDEGMEPPPPAHVPMYVE